MTSRAVFILAFLAAMAFARDDDPIHVVCKPSEDGFVVFVPHPYECSKFFMCQGFEGIAMSCPDGLQFDTTLNVCNYPDAVGCVNTPYPTTSTEAASTTEEDTTPFVEEEYVDVFV